jgi:hypothetical protein
MHGTDSFCVNQFAESELYTVIRPKYYVFADPSYWNASEPEELLLMRDRVFQRIILRTSWDLDIYAPFEARQLFVDVFSKSTNIRLTFYNNVSVSGCSRVTYALYDLGLGIPHVQNVLVAAIFLALRMHYRDIIVIGADHSWHQSLALDDANRVCLVDRHFYHSKADLRPFGEGRFTMATLFFAFGKMFEGYWALKNYSEYLGARIYNSSSTTFIDAFERRSLPEILAESKSLPAAPGG